MAEHFPQVTDRHPPATEAQIEEFEKSRGVVLPGYYRQFLLETNGGYIKDNVFPIDDFSPDGQWSVGWFFGLGEDEGLEWTFDLYRGGVRKALFR